MFAGQFIVMFCASAVFGGSLVYSAFILAALLCEQLGYSTAMRPAGTIAASAVLLGLIASGTILMRQPRSCGLGVGMLAGLAADLLAIVFFLAL